jgi:hypothetical protein
MDSPAASHGHHTGAGLALIEISVRARDHPAALDERLGVGRHIGKIHRRSEEDPIGRGHLGDIRVDGVGIDGAPFVLLLEAPETRATALQMFRRELDEFRLDAIPLQLREDGLQQDGGVPVPPCAAIERHDLHTHSSLW